MTSKDRAPSRERSLGNTNCHGTHIAHKDDQVHGAASATHGSDATAVLPGSPITSWPTLAPGADYNQHVVSYQSDGYNTCALMTITNGSRPANGWPATVFSHGCISPSEYQTTERYVAYVDAIARNGYMVFKPDLRGHGDSVGGDTVEGGSYSMSAYAVDAPDALASLSAYEEADPNRINMWGHSMGGQITLRAIVVSGDIKAGVIWAGDIANISINLGVAMQRTVAFFDRYVKDESE